MNPRKKLLATLLLASLCFLIAITAGTFSHSQSTQPTTQAGSDIDTSVLQSKPAPDFSLKTFDGKSIALSAEKGNVVLIDFWASWCIPCRVELPDISKLANDPSLTSRGVKIWAINVQDSVPFIQQVVNEDKLAITIPMDHDGAVAATYHAESLPATLIVGRDGVVRKVFVGLAKEDELRTAIEDALKK